MATATPIAGVVYSCDSANQQWIAPGRSPLPFTAPADPTAWPFNADEPWRLEAGETLTDGIDTSVPVVDASDYSTSTDLYTVLNAVDTQATATCYVRLAASTTYYINSFHAYAANDWRGFANVNKKVMGLIGAGVENGTRVQLSPTAVSSTSGAQNYALNPPTAWAPIPIVGIYLSNTNSSVPLFITGIDFRGTLQTPYGVYSSAVQTAKFRRNQGVASPLPWRGMSIWRPVDGARIQHCRFTGFGFALNSSPPFENGIADINYGLETTRRCEFDGRIAADIDASQPLSSGGWMWNKGIHCSLEDSYLHDTRRSGWATNTNTNDQSEVYIGKRVRTARIASPADGFAGDNGLFPASNVEEVVGSFTYDNCWLSVDPSRQHILLATPFSSSGGSGNLVLPSTPIITVKNGFRTDDTLYGGCLRIGVLQTPNSSGTSPAWTKLNNLGIAGSGLFDVKNSSGVAMTGVRSTSWTSAMTPDLYYVVVY